MESGRQQNQIFIFYLFNEREKRKTKIVAKRCNPWMEENKKLLNYRNAYDEYVCVQLLFLILDLVFKYLAKSMCFNFK